ITVHEGAKVGSNAVLVKDLPANATAVGIPARVIEVAEKSRAAKAEQMGFSAYGISGDMNDPVVKAIHGMLDHSVSTDKRIEAILAKLEQLGMNCEAERAEGDQFDPGYLNRIVD
ncbi:MAG: serine O-acetyltransferase, partial [Iodobacter sp.]